MNNRNDDTDDLVIVRPTWMDQQTWERIKTDSEALFDRLVAKVQTQDCPYVWCTVTNPDEHEEVHSSDIVELVGSDGTGERGWWCWLAENIAHDGGCPQLRLEGRVVDDGPALRFDFDAADAAVLLRAASNPEAQAALEDLLAQATGWAR